MSTNTHPADLGRVGASANGAKGWQLDSTENAQLRAKIDDAKRRLPLPQLMRELRYTEKSIGKTALCPFHDDRSPSFSVFQGRGGFWRYKCFVCDSQNGDEVSFLVKHFDISRREAIKRFLDMVGFKAGRPSGNKERRLSKNKEGDYYREDRSQMTGPPPLIHVAKITFDKPVTHGAVEAVTHGILTNTGVGDWVDLPNTSYAPPKENLEKWHPAELVAFIILKGNTEKRLFVLARYLAALAAKDGNPDFPLAISLIAQTLNIAKQRAARIRTRIVQKGVLIMTKPYSREEGRAERYRWAFPTTIPIPPQPKSDAFVLPSDTDEEPLF